MNTFCFRLRFLLCALMRDPSAVTAQLTDHFSDGDFNASPGWNGDTTAWQVDDRFRLNTRDTSLSQTVYLSTSLSNSKSAKWEFLLQMNFDTSSSNRFRIYLSSTNPSLNEPLQGY